MHTREKLPRLKLTSDIVESANRTLGKYLHGDKNILEITDNVYAVGMIIAIWNSTVRE